MSAINEKYHQCAPLNYQRLFTTIATTMVFIICSSSHHHVQGFVPHYQHFSRNTLVLASTQESNSINDAVDINDQISVPKTLNDMVSQVSTAIKLAQEGSSDDDDTQQQQVTRQIIRILLPRDAKSAQLGQYYESDVAESMLNNVDLESFTLIPPDETWQGGIMQLYRAISLPTRMILRTLGGTVGGVPPTIVEDRSIDTTNVDGVGMFLSQVPNNPSKDICCFAQPLQETLDAVESICEQAGKDRLVLLMNPQWRDIDDALDTVSKQGGFMGSLANFLGGKGNSLKRLDDLGFQSVYTIEGYVCKGGNVRLMKRFDSDWIVFAENDSETDYIKIGSLETRPSYQDVEKMLDDKGISLKYARDFGLAPKLE